MPSAATHLFVAQNTLKRELKEREQLQYLIGSIFPDLEAFLYKKPIFNHKPMLRFAKFLEDKGDYRYFIKGIQTHILTDNPVHAGYVLKKIKSLKKDSNIHPDVIHGLVELALDLELLKTHPEINNLNFNNETFKKAGLDDLNVHMAEFFNIKKEEVDQALNNSFQVLNIKTINSWMRLIKIYLALTKFLPKQKYSQKIKFKDLKDTFQKTKDSVKQDYKKLLSKTISTLNRKL